MELPEFPIKIGAIEYDNSFSDDVCIDRTRLDHEFATQAQKYAYYSFLAEKAKSVYQYAKFELEVVYAQVDCRKRTAATKLREQNPKFKYTEKMCENEVLTDSEYRAQKLATLKAQELAGMLTKAADAIGQRRDMLIQMGAHDRIGTLPTRALEQQHTHAKAVIAETSAKKLRRVPKNTEQGES